MAILTLYLFLFFTGGLLISRLEDLPLLTCLFESASAVGTAGLTLGITPGLGQLSRCVLILLMYCGRVGSLSFALSFTQHKKVARVKQPVGRITIG